MCLYIYLIHDLCACATLISYDHSYQTTTVTSIHQPSSAVFRGFDKLMLLADGHVVYFGTPSGSLETALPNLVMIPSPPSRSTFDVSTQPIFARSLTAAAICDVSGAEKEK